MWAQFFGLLDITGIPGSVEKTCSVTRHDLLTMLQMPEIRSLGKTNEVSRAHAIVGRAMKLQEEKTEDFS